MQPDSLIFQLPIELLAAIFGPPVTANGTQLWTDREYVRYRCALSATCATVRNFVISLPTCWANVVILPGKFHSGSVEILETMLDRTGTSSFRLTLEGWDADPWALDELERCLRPRLHRCTALSLNARSSAAIALFISRLTFPNVLNLRVQLELCEDDDETHPHFVPDATMFLNPLTSLSLIHQTILPPILGGLVTINTSHLSRLHLRLAVTCSRLILLLSQSHLLQHLDWIDRTLLISLDEEEFDFSGEHTLPSLITLHICGIKPQFTMRRYGLPNLRRLTVGESFGFGGADEHPLLLNPPSLPSLRVLSFPLGSIVDGLRPFFNKNPALELLELSAPSLWPSTPEDVRKHLGGISTVFKELGEGQECGVGYHLRDFYLRFETSVVKEEESAQKLCDSVVDLLRTVPHSRIHFEYPMSAPSVFLSKFAPKISPKLPTMLEELGGFKGRILWDVDPKAHGPVWLSPWNTWQHEAIW